MKKLIGQIDLTPLAYSEFMRLRQRAETVNKQRLLVFKMTVVFVIIFISFVVNCNPAPA